MSPTRASSSGSSIRSTEPEALRTLEQESDACLPRRGTGQRRGRPLPGRPSARRVGLAAVHRSAQAGPARPASASRRWWSAAATPPSTSRARRCGSARANVTLLYRRTEKEMPAYRHEVRRGARRGGGVPVPGGAGAVPGQRARGLEVECRRMRLGGAGRVGPLPARAGARERVPAPSRHGGDGDRPAAPHRPAFLDRRAASSTTALVVTDPETGQTSVPEVLRRRRRGERRSDGGAGGPRGHARRVRHRPLPARRRDVAGAGVIPRLRALRAGRRGAPRQPGLVQGVQPVHRGLSQRHPLARRRRAHRRWATSTAASSAALCSVRCPDFVFVLERPPLAAGEAQA